METWRRVCNQTTFYPDSLIIIGDEEKLYLVKVDHDGLLTNKVHQVFGPRDKVEPLFKYFIELISDGLPTCVNCSFYCFECFKKRFTTKKFPEWKKWFNTKLNELDEGLFLNKII